MDVLKLQNKAELAKQPFCIQTNMVIFLYNLYIFV